MKAKVARGLIALVLVLAMVVGLTTALSRPAFAATAEPAAVTTDKTAAPLDDNLETEIRLSFPGQEDQLGSDIVFVLDKSGASAQEDIYNLAKQFLDELKQQADDKGLDVKVGVVLFNYVGNIQQPLTDITTGYDDILTAMNSQLSMGTNMHAGLLAAREMLDDDTAVQAARKHVVLISDGATYLYCNDDYNTAYSRSFGNPRAQTDPATGNPYPNGSDRQGGIWEYQSREYNTDNAFRQFSDGTNFTFSNAMKDPEKLGEYLDYYRQQEQDAGKNWTQYEYEYNITSRSAAPGEGGRKETPVDVNAPANIDIAYMKTDDTFQSMADTGYDMNVYFKNAADFDGSVFLQYLARTTNNGELDTDFAELEDAIYDLIGSGSSVDDVIGKDFDFVNDPSKISLTLGEESLEAVEIGENEYGFGPLDDGSYRYKLTYTPGDEEKIHLDIYETVKTEAPLKLTYREKLVNVPDQEGEYTFDTNESAVLNLMGSNGEPGGTVEFPVPEVTYTVEPQQTEPVKPSEPAKPAPNTADDSSPVLLTLLPAACLGLIVSLTVRRRIAGR